MRSVIAASIIVALGLTACGPSESQASDQRTERTAESQAPARRAPLNASSLDPSERAATLSVLQMVRSQIELYGMIKDGDPWLAEGRITPEWSWYPFDEYFVSAPSNPLSPAAVATTVIEIKKPGATGRNVDPATAGWAWNSTDGMFYAAGFAAP